VKNASEAVHQVPRAGTFAHSEQRFLHTAPLTFHLGVRYSVQQADAQRAVPKQTQNKNGSWWCIPP